MVGQGRTYGISIFEIEKELKEAAYFKRKKE